MTQNEFQRAAGISAGLAARWYPHLLATFAEFSIEKPAAQAMFIAQVGHESAGFTRTVESLNYTPQGLLSTFGKRITAYQADMLGRTTAHTQTGRRLQTRYTPIARAINHAVMAGNIVGVG